MKMLRAAILLALLASPTAFAETKTVTLSVPGMNCDLCPLTIKKAISRVPGVASVEASYEKKQAVVTFDDKNIDESKLSVLSRSIVGRNSALPDTYGLSPEDLQALMNGWRERALRPRS